MSIPPLSRRSVLGGAAWALGAGVIGYVIARNSDAADAKSPTAAANDSGYGAGPKKGAAEPLAKVSAIPDGGGLIVASAGVVLTRDAAGNVQGFSAVCTHQGCRVTSVQGSNIVCPCHGSKFDVRTGEPTAGPAQRPLPAIEVSVVGDNVVAGSANTGGKGPG
jgi:Rieske Fe-S protein